MKIQKSERRASGHKITQPFFSGINQGEFFPEHRPGVDQKNEKPLSVDSLRKGAPPNIQLSPLSEDLERTWAFEGREAFFQQLSTVEVCDEDVVNFVERTLEGEDLVRARSLLGAQPRSQIPFRPPQTPEEERCVEIARNPAGANFFDDDIVQVTFDFWGDIFHVRFSNNQTLPVHRSKIHNESHPIAGQVLVFVRDTAVQKTVPVACNPSASELSACSADPRPNLWINRRWAPHFMSLVDYIDNQLVPNNLQSTAEMFRSYQRVVELMLIRQAVGGSGGSGSSGARAPARASAGAGATGARATLRILGGEAPAGTRTILVDTASGQVFVGGSRQVIHMQVFEAAGLDSYVGVVGGFGRFQAGRLISFELSSGTFPGTAAEIETAISLLRSLIIP